MTEKPLSAERLAELAAEHVRSRSHPKMCRQCVAKLWPCETAELVALATKAQTYRDALTRVKEGPPDTEVIPGETTYTYQLWGDHGEDARYVYPARERWFKEQAAAALEETP